MECIVGKHCEESAGKAALDCPRGSYCQGGIVSTFASLVSGFYGFHLH